METPNIGTWKYVRITPAIALEWISKDTNNRRLRETRVQRYARAMRDGEWLSTHQGIALNIDGLVIDGQHRLHAIIESGITIGMWVYYGMPHEFVIAVDEGVRRTSYETISFGDPDNLMTRTESMTALSMFDVGYTANNCGLSRSRQQEKEFFIAHRDAVRFAVKHVLTPSHTKTSVAPVAGAVARAYYYIDRDVLSRFCAVLGGDNAIGLCESAAQKLRESLLGGTIARRGHAQRVFVYQRTESAIDHFANGRTVNLLRPRGELFPLPSFLDA